MENINIKKQLRKEILLSEKLRAIMLVIFSSAAIIILFPAKYFLTDSLANSGTNPEFIYIIQLILFLFVIRELFVIRFIKKKLSLNQDVSDKVRYLTSFLEISFPSLIVISIGFFIESTEVLISPAMFIYFIIIILSTLSLEFKISLVMGVIAAVEYVIIYFILTEQFGINSKESLYNSIIFQFGKANLLIVSGIISGLVAEQMKKNITKVNKALLERNKIINLFGQQISSSIVDYLLNNDTEVKSERKYVCVMFLDIRGFTPFAESKQPEDIIQYQNDVFGFMIEIINKYDGIINQFLGDGYMATFGAPLSTENDCQNALDASLEIIRELSVRNKKRNFYKTEIGIGLHSGYVVAGNVGTEIRKQYSISGNTVILASRIEQLNKQFNSQLLISKEVLENVKIEHENVLSHGEVKLKGREIPLEIFQLK